MISVSANGIYAVASKFSSIINVIYSVFNMAWTETVSLYINDEDRDEFLSTMINELYNIFFAVCIGVISCMPFVFKYFVNEEYGEAYMYIPILMMAVFAQIVCGLFSVIFMAKKDTKENAKTAFLAAIINIIFNILFIKWLGLYAAAISTLVAYLSMAVYRYVSVQKYVRIKIKSKVLVGSAIMCILACFAYYYEGFLIKVFALASVVLYAIITNFNILKSLWKTVYVFLKKNCKNE